MTENTTYLCQASSNIVINMLPECSQNVVVFPGKLFRLSAAVSISSVQPDIKIDLFPARR